MEIQTIKDKVTDKADCTDNNSCHEGNPSAVAVEDNAPVASEEPNTVQALEQLKSKWEEKPLHGQYPKRTKEKDVDQDKTHSWLSTPGLKSETEGFIIAAQDQCIMTTITETRS